MATELNKFLISLVTLLFGAVAFYLTNVRKAVQMSCIVGAFLIAFVLLGFSYFFAFMCYSQMTTGLAQNALGMIPGKSKILYYLEMEFWTVLGASLTMLSIFMPGISERQDSK